MTYINTVSAQVRGSIFQYEFLGKVQLKKSHKKCIFWPKKGFYSWKKPKNWTFEKGWGYIQDWSYTRADTVDDWNLSVKCLTFGYLNISIFNRCWMQNCLQFLMRFFWWWTSKTLLRLLRFWNLDRDNFKRNKRSYFMKEGAYCECFYSPQDSNTRPYWSDN